MTPRILILSAGRASRLGGVNKLLQSAGGLPVLEWHRRFAEGHQVAIVTTPQDAGMIALSAPWADRVVGHGDFDGPVGALAAYLRAYPDPEPLVVLFADTLLPPQSLSGRDFVGVAPAPARRWDFPDLSGFFVRGVPQVEVCVGVYGFSDHPALIKGITQAFTDAAFDGEKEVGFFRLLNAYHSDSGLYHVRVRGWHDCGDQESRAKVPAWESVILEDPQADRISGRIHAGFTR